MSTSSRSPSISTTTPSSVQTPIPIHRVAHHYYLYSAPSISHLRAKHSIPGTLIGSLPQCPQQNVFLGLPVLLSYAETRRLVTTGAGYIVDDAAAHKNGLRDLGRGEKMRWMMRLKEEGMRVAKAQEDTKKEESRVAMAKQLERLKEEVISLDLKGEKRERVLRKLRGKEEEQVVKNDILDTNQNADATSIEDSVSRLATPSSTNTTDNDATTKDEEESLFDTLVTTRSSTPLNSRARPPQPPSTAYSITPTLSTPPFPQPSPSHHHEPPPRPTPTTALHAYLHSQSYFLLPGLRFGSHFNAYPGDPLRFHAHSLCRAYEWEEEIEIMELVGGGRLGTGVKKGFLIGGPVGGSDAGNGIEGEEDGGDVRCFCIEWGGM